MHPEREHWSERLVLIADELTSNALRHGGLPVATALSRTGDQWLVAVSDTSTEVPPAPAVGRDPGLGGFGLYLVADLVGTARLVRGAGHQDGLGRRPAAAPTAEPVRATASYAPVTSRVTSVAMSLAEQMDTVTDASAGTVDRHATTETFDSTDPASGAVVGVFPVHDADGRAGDGRPRPPRGASSGPRSAGTAASSG